MSLQPGINPLDRRVPVWGPNPHRIGRKTTRPFPGPGFNPNPEPHIYRQEPPVYGPGPGQHYSFPTRDISAEEAMRKRTPALSDPNFLYKTMEYVPERDKSERRTLEYIPETGLS